MPVPALAIAALIAGQALKAGSNLYSQEKQRELYRYQKQGYERMQSDWHKNVPRRQIRYPEQSYPGRIRAIDTGISQSYASSLGSISSLGSGFAYGGNGGYSHAGSLYSKSTGRSSRYL